MDKDPVERERQFRQSIERHVVFRRSAQTRRVRQRPGWFGSRRNRSGLLLLLIMLLAFVGFFVFLFGLQIKWTEAYACSLAQARRSPTVIAELGEPVAPGFFAWSSSYSQGGSSTSASFRIALQGPKGEGTLFVNWYTSPIGTSLQMELLKDGKMSHAYAGAAQCPQ